ncbi:MAG: RNA polymerase sigma factor [Burkholderiaceae bacterium]
MPGLPMRDAALDTLYRRDGRKVFATLVRLLGDFTLAEEALHDAFVAAAEHWPTAGVPSNPVAWLVSAGRFKAIDGIRRQRRMVGWDEAGEATEHAADDAANWDEHEPIEDDRLRLVFTCCHPSLAEDARIALTLREVCGLATEEIARAFLLPATTLAQRIVRAKAKIRAARIPYEVPAGAALDERLPSVLRTLYLVFNEGYSASAGTAVTRADLMEEAIRLARLLRELLPRAEVGGLLALMMLHHARRDARCDAAGDLVSLDEQDRSRWDRVAIAEASKLVQDALRSQRSGPYTLQAAIAAVHAEALSAAQTDWSEIAGLYDALLAIEPSPVVALNRAVAIAMRDGPEAGLALIDGLIDTAPLATYHLAHAARADLLRRCGRDAEARSAYEAALNLAAQEPERRFLQRCLARLGSSSK